MRLLQRLAEHYLARRANQTSAAPGVPHGAPALAPNVSALASPAAALRALYGAGPVDTNSTAGSALVERLRADLSKLDSHQLVAIAVLQVGECALLPSCPCAMLRGRPHGLPSRAVSCGGRGLL